MNECDANLSKRNEEELIKCQIKARQFAWHTLFFLQFEEGLQSNVRTK